ncbi:integrase, partial [Shigella flexneri]|nr:integrase [Shigella flexneri]
MNSSKAGGCHGINDIKVKTAKPKDKPYKLA